MSSLSDGSLLHVKMSLMLRCELWRWRW